MKIASGPPGFSSLFMTHQNRADHTFWPHLRKNKQKMKTEWTTHSWNNAIWLALRLCHMTMMCKINKLEKPGRPQGNFHALFGRSAAFYGHFWVDTVTLEWSTCISSSNVRDTIQFRREGQPWHLKRRIFLQDRSIHFHFNRTSVIRPAKASWVFSALKSTSHFLP